MKNVTIIVLLLLVPFTIFGQSGETTKPGVTVYLRDGKTAAGRLDAFDDKRVLIFDKTNQAVYYDRSKVLCISITQDAGGRFSSGQEGIVLKNGTVLKGRVGPMDFSDRAMPQVVVQTGKKKESVQLSDVAFVQFEKPFPQASAPPGAVSVVVPAYQQWTDTNVEVKKGYRMFFSVSADNLVTCGAKSGDVNADGADPFWYDGSRPIPDAKECTLIARAGRNGAPFKVGLNKTPVVAQEDGAILLGMNDNDFRDNSGEFLVFVKVESAGQFQPGQSGLNQTSVTVPAIQPWTVTNISVKKGQSLNFDVSPDNTIQCERLSTHVNADGVDPFVFDSRRPMAKLKVCALIGKVNNNGEPFKIGLNKTPIVVQQDGMLMLGINDFDFRDNAGAFNVTVVVSQ